MQWTSDWWRRNGWTLAILLSAVAAAFAVRTIWTYPIIQQWGALYTYAGGSDSYYHSRVMSYIILTHTNLIHDPMLRFPFGEINPREPLFDWMNAILGLVFAPLFGGNAQQAGAWFLDFQGPFWAALTVIPVYLVGKEVSSARTGLIAAAIFPFLPASIDSSIFGYANYLSFYTFIIVVVVYAWIRTIRSAGTHRYVPRYRSLGAVRTGLRDFYRYERSTVKWAVFTGVSLGALALAWQGYTYGVVVVALSVLVVVIEERIRRVDSFSVYVSAWIVGAVAFPMAIPYYLVQQQFVVWFALPLLLYFGTLLLLLPFMLMRDYPWVISIPSLLGLVVVAAAGLAVVSPSQFDSIVTGQGYFVKSLIYSTVAEAQAPSIDQLVIAYGVITFFLAFVGVALVVYRLARGRFPRHLIVFLIFGLLSIALPITASKFFLLGSPGFALLPAEAIRQALDVAGYPELRRSVASLSDRRSQFTAFRRSFKARHVLIMVLVVGLLLPNIWYSLDAGIPGNTKAAVGTQVGDSLPSWLQPTSGPASSVYFGAAGTSLDTPNQYDSAGYNWLALQDTALPAAQRPAFVSWWDYGFQAIDQGQHPSVADNFQNGIDPAGQFLLAQNESLAVGVLATTLLVAEQQKSGLIDLPADLNAILSADGLNVSRLHTLLADPAADYTLVVAHPTTYLPVDPSTLTDLNAEYLATSYFLADSLPLSGVAQVYDDIQSYTGWTIRYDMTDSRLIPFSGQSTGIFYAPADLTGRLIDAAGLPSTYFNVTVLGSNGQSYPLGFVPPTVSAVNYTINYFPAFYQSMIYRTYFGYNGTEIGQGGGIPGLSSNLANSPVMPGWMMQHFEVVYKTAFWCPSPQANAAGNCDAENTPTALAMAAAQNGSVANTTDIRYFEGGESMLEYYPGETMLGTVTLPDGTPVSGVRVTVTDQWGIPHMTEFTGSLGNFSLVLPPGNDTVNVTTGTLQGLSQQGNILIRSVKVYVPPALALNLHPPTLVESIPVQGAPVSGTVYWNIANNTTYVPSVDRLVPGAQVVLWGPNGLAPVRATTDADGTFDLPTVAPGVYNYSVLVDGQNYSETQVFVHPNSPTSAPAGLTGGEIAGNVTLGKTPIGGVRVTLGNALGTVATAVTNITGRYSFPGLAPGNYTITASGPAPTDQTPGQLVEVPRGGGVVKVPLTVISGGQAEVVVTTSGGGIGGIAVRFVPLPQFANASVPILTALQDASQNGTTAVTGPNGAATVTLPVGNYSVYALGYVGNALESALGTTAVLPGGIPSGVTTLALAPSATLSGTVANAASSTNVSAAAVLVYGPGLTEATAWTNLTGGYSIVVPIGSYSLLALEGGRTPGGVVTAALARATVGYPTVVDLQPVASVTTHFLVGATLSGGTFYPAGAATVSIAAGANGPTVTALAQSDGAVTAILPSQLPLSAGAYCVAVASAGFQTASACGYSPSGLAGLTDVNLAFTPVPVTLRVLGLPAGTSININLSAESSSATTHNLTGGPTFSFTTTPGDYTLSARATYGNGSVVYIPSQILRTVIPLGAASSALTLVVVPAVNSTGALTLPSGAAASATSIALASPRLNVTVNGTAYASTGVRLAPGPYTAHATVTVGNETYTSLERVVVSSTGAISPAIAISSPAVSVAGSLRTASGSAAPVNATVTLTASDGSTVTTRATNGSFAVTLPVNATFAVTAASIASVAGPNGSYLANFSVVPGSVCTTAPSVSSCSVPVSESPVPVWFNGTLTAPGQPGPVPGSVRLVGPYPSTNVSNVVAANGSFSVQVAPGAYAVYATAGGGSHPFANLTSTVVLPGSTPVDFALRSTWNVLLSIGGPNGTTAGLGPATIALYGAGGADATFSAVPIGSTVSLALPIGTYRLSVTAYGTLNGIPSNATYATSVVVASGNVAVHATLAYRPTAQVSATLVGASSATVAGGGSATFQFSLRNTGNVPLTVHPVGAPAYWTFGFSVPNVTLDPGPAGGTATIEATVTVPAGTVVGHPGVQIELETANGTVVGTVAPAPTVNVVGYYGLEVGPWASSAPTVAPATALVPFTVANTGNTFELVRLTILDEERLTGLGWASRITNLQHATISAPVGLSAGANLTYFLQLNATGPVFLPPNYVTVAGSVVNASGAVQSGNRIPVPSVPVHPTAANGNPLLTVTGPNLGTPPSTLPSWVVPVLVFVPAIALAVALVSWRWWRTRRWTRR